MNKTALIIAYYFPPLGMGGVQRMAKLAKYLPKYGYDVSVLTVKPIRYAAYDASLLDELPAGVSIHRSGSGDPARIGRFLPLPARAESRIPVSTRDALKKFWPDSKIGWKRAALRTARKIIGKRKIDVVLSSSPPITAHLIAMELCREFKLPWVADFRDIWESRPPEDIYTDKERIDRAYALLGSIADHSDAITRVNDSIGANVFGSATTIMSGYDPDDFKFPEAKRADRNGFSLCYMGSSGPLAPIEPFFQAARIAAEREPAFGDQVRFRIIGIHDERSLKQAAGRHGWEKRIDFPGYLPHGEALRLASTASAYLLSVPNEHPHITTGKIFDYLALPAPILAAVPTGGEAKRLIREYHGGLCSPPGDMQMLAENVLSVFRNAQRGESWHKEDISKLSRLETARHFAAVFDRVIHG